jgi:uncharacterized membrane protein
MKMEGKEDDLPKSIVVILVVLAVAISILGTFTVLNEMNRINSAPVQQGTPTQSAKVQFQVSGPAVGQSAPAIGKVIFRVENPEVS